MSGLKQLAEALRYPAEIPVGARAFSFLVDGLEIQAEERAHGLLLRFILACSDDLLPELAGYAAGRMVLEDAVLAWDGRALILWREIPTTTDVGMTCRIFEQFVDSCEWWLARCAEREVPQSVLPDILIRP